MEHENLSNGPVTVVSTLYDNAGVQQGQAQFSIPEKGKFDLLVHEMSGWTNDSFGKVCSTVVNGHTGDLQGRMVYYRSASPIKAADGHRFDFVMVIPFSAGKSGEQSVVYSTTMPNSFQRIPFVANWLHIRNLESSAETGQLNLWDETGSLVSSQSITLPPGGRQDFAAHEVGSERMGIATWIPTNPASRFIFRNQRYLFDNFTQSPSFVGAYSLEGIGGGETVLAGTGGVHYLEIANSSNSPINISLTTSNDAEDLNQTQSISIPPHAAIQTEPNSVGISTVESNTPGVIAHRFSYDTNFTPNYFGLSEISGRSLAPPIATNRLFGACTMHVSQSCRIRIGSTSGSDTTARVFVYNFLGVWQYGRSLLFAVPRNGVSELDLSDYARGTLYSRFEVEFPSSVPVFGEVLRKSYLDRDKFDAPLNEN